MKLTESNNCCCNSLWLLKYCKNVETDKTPQETPIAQTSLENEPVHKNLLNQRGSFLLILSAVVIILVVLGAGGYLLTMNKNQNSNQYISQPLPTLTQPTSSNETANWKIYISRDTMFSFKYPGETTIAPYETNEGITHLEFREKLPKDSPDGYELAPGFIMDFKIGFLDTKTIKGVAEDKIVQAKEYANITKPLTTTKINDYSGYIYSSVVQVETTSLFLLSHQDNSYIGINYSINDQNHKGYSDTINQILSTFKFLDQKQTSDISTWKIYSSECDFQISSPPAWKTKKFFFEDTPDSCVYITAPDYKEFRPHGREGFSIEITRFQKGSTIGNQIIQSLNDYISIENNITGSFLEVINKKDKVIGKFIGKEFEPRGAEYQIKFIFEEGQYVYSVAWPGEYREEYKSGYRGTYNKELDSIINSINFK